LPLRALLRKPTDLRSERRADPTDRDNIEPQLQTRITTSPLSGGSERIWRDEPETRIGYGFLIAVCVAVPGELRAGALANLTLKTKFGRSRPGQSYKMRRETQRSAV